MYTHSRIDKGALENNAKHIMGHEEKDRDKCREPIGQVK